MNCGLLVAFSDVLNILENPRADRLANPGSAFLEVRKRPLMRWRRSCAGLVIHEEVVKIGFESRSAIRVRERELNLAMPPLLFLVPLQCSHERVTGCFRIDASLRGMLDGRARRGRWRLRRFRQLFLE